MSYEEIAWGMVQSINVDESINALRIKRNIKQG